ncbi:hydantoinase/oxoprolinase family protein [Ottowia thiooxydans]|uniref:hydantoinase/oxoprolinase family protein n=1 Tax=Ottowia thiooxydans TaxID=219182 RepID=UPI0004038DCC|nr:hydantoinase/oxoprolinase family protein [Ottowia thiooxydans]
MQGISDNKRYLVAVDTGGTFTDLAVYDTHTGQAHFGKTLTTSSDLVIGAMQGLADTGVSVAEARFFTHGTTHVINSLIERRGGRTALVTTRGFRDVLEIGRGNRAEPFNLRYRRDPPLINRELRLEVTERISGQGEVITPLAEDELAQLAEQLTTAGVQAVAVSFLNAYRNPAHEEAAATLLRTLLPGVFVSTGSSLTRELMEYERTATVAANAFVGARMTSYIDSFGTELDKRGFTGNFYLMGSNGGVMSAPSATRAPIALVESGPVGGCIGAAAYAKALGLDRVVAFDMGGTTAKCALIEGASFDVVNTYFVNGYERGFPVRTPVLDIVEIGAGGGSLAWLDENHRMRIGPRSAGSEPGPIAFGRGGTQPTVTDANVVLGRIGSGSFMDGKLPLDVEAAILGVRKELATPLGMEGEAGVDRAAQGILDLACVAMANVVKEITIERGRDVREYKLIAFGGGGPIFASELARSLGIRDVVIPPNPGAFSSFGMLLAPVRRDVSAAFMEKLDTAALERAGAQFAQLEREGQAALMAEMEMDSASLRFRREADMSYAGQSHSVKVAFPSDASVASVREAFEAAYRARYGHLNEDSPISVVVLRVVCEVPIPGPDLSAGIDTSSRGSAAQPQPVGTRAVYFASSGRVATAVYRRNELAPGICIEGPAVIEEFSSTTLLAPGDRLTVGVLGELNVSCHSAASPASE